MNREIDFQQAIDKARNLGKIGNTRRISDIPRKLRRIKIRMGGTRRSNSR